MNEMFSARFDPGPELWRKHLSVVDDFPWPVTNDDLLLNNALTIVTNALTANVGEGKALPREEAAELIVEAYNQGIRDPDILAQYALKALIKNGGIRR